MRGKNRARNGETHSGSFAPAASALAAVKLLKDQRQVLGIDAGPVIFDVEIQTVVAPFTDERDARTGWRVAGHIFEQVAQHAAQQMRIEPCWLITLGRLVTSGRLIT